MIEVNLLAPRLQVRIPDSSWGRVACGEQRIYVPIIRLGGGCLHWVRIDVKGPGPLPRHEKEDEGRARVRKVGEWRQIR